MNKKLKKNKQGERQHTSILLTVMRQLGKINDNESKETIIDSTVKQENNFEI